MFCLPSLESNVSQPVSSLLQPVLLQYISWPHFWMPLYSACFTSFSHSSAFFHSLNFCFLVSTAFSTSSHHHQVSLCLHLAFVTPQDCSYNFSHCFFQPCLTVPQLSHCPQYLYSFLVTFLSMPSLPLVSSASIP